MKVTLTVLCTRCCLYKSSYNFHCNLEKVSITLLLIINLFFSIFTLGSKRSHFENVYNFTTLRIISILSLVGLFYLHIFCDFYDSTWLILITKFGTTSTLRIAFFVVILLKRFSKQLIVKK